MNSLKTKMHSYLSLSLVLHSLDILHIIVFSVVRLISNFPGQVRCHMYYNASVVVHHWFRSVLTSSSSLVRFNTRFFHEFTCAEKKHTRHMKQKLKQQIHYQEVRSRRHPLRSQSASSFFSQQDSYNTTFHQAVDTCINSR